MIEPGQREWGRCYFIVTEHPVEGVIREGRVLKGKERPRIDIFVENSEPTPRATFVFEAKRFYPKSDETKYVGEEGLGTLLNGTKGRQDRAAGMLGYVQVGSIPAVKLAVEAKLTGDRTAHGLDPSGEVWTQVSLDARIPATFVSRHNRTSGLPPLAVYHSFLPCCAAALPASPSTP
ncbi:MAG: hypothetical protein IPN01_11790 [Deltaproteobacteria bacterium]|nr:hypothetical protein [Deltaproteobacteria bacterium]